MMPAALGDQSRCLALVSRHSWVPGSVAVLAPTRWVWRLGEKKGIWKRKQLAHLCKAPQGDKWVGLSRSPMLLHPCLVPLPGSGPTRLPRHPLLGTAERGLPLSFPAEMGAFTGRSRAVRNGVGVRAARDPGNERAVAVQILFLCEPLKAGNCLL